MKPLSIKIKESTIFLTSAIVAFLIHSKRLLELFNLTTVENPEFTEATIYDYLLRFATFFLYSWLILKFNLVWKDNVLTKSSRLVRGLVSIIGNIVISISLFILFVHIYKLIFGIQIPELEQQGAAFGWFIVLVTLLMIVYIFRLQLISRNVELEKEHFKQEKIKSELVAIKNQVNPHFLFNALNTLNSVIRTNPENATHFVDKLSFMYRYILQSSEKGLVSLDEELKFLSTYEYLIGIRYRKRFKLINELNLNSAIIELPVLSLQVLVENAIKHNEISENCPLHVKIYNDDNWIYVENKMKPRSNFEESTGNGLINLSKRCKMLLNEDIKIQKNTNFVVKLPIR